MKAKKPIKKRSNRKTFGMFLTYFTTIGTTSNPIIQYEDSYAIAIGVPTNDATIVNGMMTKLNADGTVSKVAASTDKPFGMVVSSYKKSDNTVRVLTPFNLIGLGIVDATALIATGDSVAASGIDGTTGLTTYKTAASGDYVCGICLLGGAIGATVNIGLFRSGATIKA